MKRPSLAVAAAAAALSGVFAVSSASAQDFDCRTAASGAETTICGNVTLRKLDDRMAEYYGLLWGALGHPKFGDSQRLDLRADQREFLAGREACGTNTRCLITMYEQRNLGLATSIRLANRRIATTW